MINLTQEKEIFDFDRNKPQLLTGHSYVEVAHEAIGIASRCWTEKEGKGEFDMQMALRLANELCAFMRLISQPIDNLEYLEWKLEKKETKVDLK